MSPAARVLGTKEGTVRKRLHDGKKKLVVVGMAIELAAGDVPKKKWLPKTMEGRSLGAFAVHESDSPSELIRPFRS